LFFFLEKRGFKPEFLGKGVGENGRINEVRSQGIRATLQKYFALKGGVLDQIILINFYYKYLDYL